MLGFSSFVRCFAIPCPFTPLAQNLPSLHCDLQAALIGKAKARAGRISGRGDDAIQRRTQGHIVPESFNLGTSEQRARWFSRGFESGRIDRCDTFNTQSL